MRSQRNQNTKLDSRRSIKSIRVIQEDDVGLSSSRNVHTSRRSSTKYIPNKPESQDSIVTHRNKINHRHEDQKQNQAHQSNYKTVNDLLKNHTKIQSQMPVSKSCQQQIYIEQMMEKLQQKETKQLDTLARLAKVPRELEMAKQTNTQLRHQLQQMKELMKALLLEREEIRMFSFYADE